VRRYDAARGAGDAAGEYAAGNDVHRDVVFDDINRSRRSVHDLHDFEFDNGVEFIHQFVEHDNLRRRPDAVHEHIDDELDDLDQLEHVDVQLDDQYDSASERVGLHVHTQPGVTPIDQLQPSVQELAVLNPNRKHQQRALYTVELEVRTSGHHYLVD
jgi:hypothetical protein